MACVGYVFQCRSPTLIIKLTDHKTRHVQKALETLGASNALIVDAANQNLQLGARNLPKSRYLNVGGLNVYDILNHRNLIMTESAAKAIERRLTGQEA